MKKQWITTMAVAAMACMTSAVQGATWSGGNGNWTNETSWGGSEPVSGDLAAINNGDTVTVDQTGEVAGQLAISGGSTVNVDAGGDLTLDAVSQSASLNINNGALNVAGGAVTVEGVVNNFLNNSAVINVTAGSVSHTAANFRFGDGTTTATLDVSGSGSWSNGQLVIVGTGNINLTGSSAQIGGVRINNGAGTAMNVNLTPDSGGIHAIGVTDLLLQSTDGLTFNTAGLPGEQTVVLFQYNALSGTFDTVHVTGLLGDLTAVPDTGSVVEGTYFLDYTTGSEVTLHYHTATNVPFIAWDGGGADDSWTTAANWYPDGVPATSNDVFVGSSASVVNGQNEFDTLTIGAGASVTFSEWTASGNVITNAGVLNYAGVYRLTGAPTITLTGTGSFGPDITHLDTQGATINFHDGASFANPSTPFEHRISNTFGYTLSETGFMTLIAGTLFDGGATWADATYNIDVSAYNYSNGLSVVLADYSSHSGAFNGTFDPTVNIIATNGLGGELTFDTTLSQLVLTLDPPGNDAPVAYDQTISVTTNGPTDFSLTATDIEGSNLMYSIVDAPTNGKLSGSAPDLTYTATNSPFTFDSFTFTAFDGEDVSNTGTVTIAFVPSTAAELWSLYHPAILSDPLNTEWLTNWVVNGISIWQMRYDLGPMTGSRTNATPKMAAFYAYPIGGTNLPGLVQTHGGGQKGSEALARFWAEQGYAAISINWGAGELLPGVPNTDWDGLPAGHFYPGTDFQNWTDPHATATHASLYDVSHPLNCSWILNSYAGRRALTFLQSLPYVDGSKLGVTGHSMGGQNTVLMATDPRISCITPSVGGAGYYYEDWWGVPGSARSAGGTRYLDHYNQTAAAQSYWPDITCPSLFLTAANDFNAAFDVIIRAMDLQPTNVPQRVAFVPHQNHRFDTDSYAARVLWQRAHLTDGFDFPDRAVAELDLTEEGGVPVFRVWPDESTSNTVVGVDIYYGIDRQILSRFFRDAQAVETNGHWEAACPVFDVNEMIVALAVVTYDHDFDLAMPPGYANPTRTFSVASEVALIYPPDLETNGILATAEKERLIDDFSRVYKDWIASNIGNASWSLFTRKLTDPSWIGPAGGDLAMEVVTTTVGNTLGIKLNTVNWNETPAGTYTAAVALPLAGTNSVSVSVSDFTNGQGAALTTWDDATWMTLSSASGYPAWTGSGPEIENLRWAGGVYTFTNGVTSTWLEQYGLPLNDLAVLSDSDGDGLSAWEEEVAGTNPTNRASVLRAEEVVSVTNGQVFSWQAVSGKSYTVWFKTNLTDSVWIEQATGIAGVEPSSTHTVVTDTATGFVRVSVQ